MTQKQTVLDDLKRAGNRGVLGFSWLDNKRIARYSARICELRKEGYNITRKKEGKGYRFFLKERVAHYNDKTNTVRLC